MRPFTEGALENSIRLDAEGARYSKYRISQAKERSCMSVGYIGPADIYAEVS